MKNNNNNKRLPQVRCRYDKGIDDSFLLLRIQSSMEKPVTRVKPMQTNQPSQTEKVNPMTRNECPVLTACRSTVNSVMRELYHKQLANESYFHGYLTEKDASEILKYKPNGKTLHADHLRRYRLDFTFTTETTMKLRSNAR
ncbi:Myocilin [Trichinella pseudospiralis]